MFAVGYGYNVLFVTMGIFETQEKMDEVLFKMGARFMTEHHEPHPFHPEKTIIVREHWEITQEFLDALAEMKLGMYSTGGDVLNDWLIIKEFEVNKFVFRYDDD